MSYSSEVLADSPVWYARLGDSSGTTMVDSSGNSRNGTYTNSPTLGVAGPLFGDSDTSVTFAAASTQKGSVANGTWMNLGSTLTLEAWVKSTAVSGVIVGRQGDSNSPYYLALDAAGKPVLTIKKPGDSTITGPSAINDGNWHHVVGTLSSGNMSLYVDGSLVTGPTAGGTPQTRTDPLGVATRGTALYLTGTVDEAALYSTALSGTRIAAHYAAGVSTISAPAATATAAGLVPTVSAGSTVTSTVATATAAGLAPSVTADFTASPPAATATAAGVAPTFSNDQTIAAPAATATAEAIAPTVSVPGDQTILAPAADATATALAPTVFAESLVVAPTATATAAALAPSVAADSALVAPAATATADAIPPTVSTVDPNATVSAPTATATATALAPTVFILYGTDLTNALAGRRRSGLGIVTYTAPVTAPPDTLVLATRVEKAVAYPTPTMVDGRPT